MTDKKKETGAAQTEKRSFRNLAKIAAIFVLAALGLCAGFAGAAIPASKNETDIFSIAAVYVNTLVHPMPATKPVTPMIVALDPITTNMRSSASGHFIQVQFSLKTDSARAEQLGMLKPALHDALTFYLRSLDELDFVGTEKLLDFKTNIKRRVALLDETHAIDDVFINTMLIQ